MIGIESHPLDRFGPVARRRPGAVDVGHAVPEVLEEGGARDQRRGGRRPLVVLANLAGFDGSPESMRQWQLEYGAEIGRAVVNFRGPIVFCVISRYHGGAFVVFSQRLNEGFEAIAVEGLARVRDRRLRGGRRGLHARRRRGHARRRARRRARRARSRRPTGPSVAACGPSSRRCCETVRSEKMGELAAKFDAIHIDRASGRGRLGASIVAPADLRPVPGRRASSAA